MFRRIFIASSVGAIGRENSSTSKCFGALKENGNFRDIFEWIVFSFFKPLEKFTLYTEKNQYCSHNVLRSWNIHFLGLFDAHLRFLEYNCASGKKYGNKSSNFDVTDTAKPWWIRVSQLRGTTPKWHFLHPPEAVTPTRARACSSTSCVTSIR